MDWFAPRPVTIPDTMRPFDRLTGFLGHYDCRVYLNDDAYIDLGAGSLASFTRVRSLEPGFVGSLGSIGRFCDIHEAAMIMAAGEHDHAKPVNVTFGGVGYLRNKSDHRPMKPTLPISIGNGVILSANAVVLSGVKVGDGAVVAAGAVVNKDVEPLTIAGGVPARELSRRQPFQPWWNFDPAYLFSNLSVIQDLALQPGPHPWRVDRPRFVIRVKNGSFDIAGFLDGDVIRPLGDAPDRVRHYLINAFGEGDPHWMLDCWA